MLTGQEAFRRGASCSWFYGSEVAAKWARRRRVVLCPVWLRAANSNLFSIIIV
jgi:hypothetical protein